MTALFMAAMVAVGVLAWLSVYASTTVARIGSALAALAITILLLAAAHRLPGLVMP